MKLLSIIIPAYNTSAYIEKCLNSLTHDKRTLKQLNIIVVNDGSQDDTASKVEKYCKKYPHNIRLINKKNGGHGSAINAGLKIAEGTYVKILDSDDWLDIQNFPILVKNLGNENVDIVLTRLIEEIIPENRQQRHEIKQPFDRVLKIDEQYKQILDYPDSDFWCIFCMSTMTVKKEKLLLAWEDGLFENTFYVDVQLVFKGLLHSNTYKVYDLDIYHYYVGRAEQSVDAANFYQHRRDHEKICKWALQSVKQSTRQSYKAILEKRLVSLLGTHYDIYISHKQLPRKAKKEIISFNKMLKSTYPSIYRSCVPAQKLRRRLSPFLRNRMVYNLVQSCKKIRKK